MPWYRMIQIPRARRLCSTLRTSVTYAKPARAIWATSDEEDSGNSADLIQTSASLVFFFADPQHRAWFRSTAARARDTSIGW